MPLARYTVALMKQLDEENRCFEPVDGDGMLADQLQRARERVRNAARRADMEIMTKRTRIDGTWGILGTIVDCDCGDRG